MYTKKNTGKKKQPSRYNMKTVRHQGSALTGVSNKNAPDLQPVKIAEKQSDVFRTPRGEDESGGNAEDHLQRVQQMTSNTSQYRAAVV